MISLNSMRHNKLYKGKLIIKDNKGENTVLFSMGNDINATKALLQDKNVKLYMFKSYFSPYIETLKMSIFEKKYTFNQNLNYSNIRDLKSNINYYKRNLKDYSNRSTIFEFCDLNKTFFSTVSLPPKRKSINYLDLIKYYLNSEDIKNHKKVLYIPFTYNNMKTRNDFLIPQDINNPLQAFGNLISYNKDLLVGMGDVKILIHEPNSQLFVLTTIGELEFNIAYITKVINTLSKLVANETLNVQERKLIEEVKSEETNEIDIEEVVEDKAEELAKYFTDKFLIDGLKSFSGEKVEELSEKAKEVIAESLAKNNGKLDNKELEENEKLIQLAKELSDNTLKKSIKMSKRDELLREEHKKAEISEGVTLSDVLDSHQNQAIEKHKIDKTDLIYDDLKFSTIGDFEANYVEKQYLKDQAMVLDAFSKENKDIQMYIRKIEREDTSDYFNKKETLTVHFEDSNRVRHTFKVDVPKIIDNKYLLINGNKKGFVKQLILKPVVKTAPDAVQLVSNYNKVFIYRRGLKTSSKIEKVKKILLEINHRDIEIKKADNSLVNTIFLTNLEYDEFAKDTFFISIKDRLITFNQNNVRKLMHEINFDENKLGKHELPIGLDNGKLIILNTKTEVVEGTNLSLCDYIIESLKPIITDIDEQIANAKVGKKYLYSEASVLSRTIPLIIFLAYKDGLTTVLKKANVNYTFYDKRPSLSNQEKLNKGVIQFADGYLVFDLYPLRNSLLLNPLLDFETKSYEYAMFDQREVYIEFINQIYGTRTLAKALDNVYQLFLDPITLEVIRDLGLPEDFTELFLYANALLEDNSYVKENEMSNYRIRSVELINAYLYRVLADAYKVYKDSRNASNPIKVTVPQNKLLKELLLSLNTEDVNILNPIVSATNNCTYKGLSGLNLDESYKLDKRAYSDSMSGVLGISTPYNSSVGVTREVSYNSNITSVRGYIDSFDRNEKNVEDLDPSNLLTAAELITTFGANHDDPPRVAMNSTQTRHTVPVNHASKLLVGTGVDKTLAHVLDSTFVNKAKQDGKVIHYDNDTEILIVEYKDGSKDAIDLRSKLDKNGGGGFFITNVKKTDLKVGDKFKKDDIIAYNENFFQKDTFTENPNFTVGTLAKIAIYSGYYTYEDSLIVSEKLSKKMSTDITMKKDLVLGKNTNIIKCLDPKSPVSVGEAIITMEDSYDEKEANMLLAKIGDEYKQDVLEQGRNTIYSKYSGEIADIEVYYTCEFEELSPSLQKLIKRINKIHNDREKLLNQHFKQNTNSLNVDLRPTGKVEASSNGKIKGVEVGDGVLIRIFVRYNAPLGVGDKVSFYCALKGIIQQCLPEELSPFTESYPEEKIEAILSPGGVQARMTASAILNLTTNKVLIELKRKIREMYGLPKYK